MIKKENKIVDIIMNNQSMIFVIERFEIELGLQDKTIEDICKEYSISTNLFLTIANLHSNKNTSISESAFTNSEIENTIKYLKNEHSYYSGEIFIEISESINSLSELQSEPETLMLKQYFNNYKNEVQKHFNYENDIVFPYISKLLLINSKTDSFDIKQYKELHDNIEEKLYDLRKLLIQYIPSKNDVKIRRKILVALSKLENDIKVHTKIEEEIIMPFAENLEKRIANG